MRRAKTKIDKEFVKGKAGDRDRADRDYGTAKDDLERILLTHPSLKPAQPIPQSSDDKGIEQTLDEISTHFESEKAAAFESARDILGERFDSADPALLSDLEKNISRALERVSQPGNVASAARLGVLRQLKSEQLDAAEAKIRDILAEAKALDALAQNPFRRSKCNLDWLIAGIGAYSPPYAAAMGLSHTGMRASGTPQWFCGPRKRSSTTLFGQSFSRSRTPSMSI